MYDHLAYIFKKIYTYILYIYILFLGAPFGSFVGGYMFDRLGSIASFKYLTGIALAICVTQTFANWLINRYSKDKSLKENTSSTDGPAIVGIGNDHL